MNRRSNSRGKWRAILFASAGGFMVAASPPAGAASFTTFVVTGATETFPAALNANGDVAGTWYDADQVPHGFLRTAEGTITSFDPAGSIQTNVYGMNDSRTIVGAFQDSNGTHGFARNSDGAITVFDAPKSLNYTQFSGVNDNNEFTGWYAAKDGNGYSFLIKNGKFKKFAISGQRYTIATALGSKGVVAGYQNGDNGLHLFVRSLNGTLTTFDVPGGNNPDAAGVNAKGSIAGTSYENDDSNTGQGFLRLSNGTFDTFQVVSGYETDGYAVNVGNWVCGTYYDAGGDYHGFIRKTNGNIVTIDAPGSVGATGCGAISDTGVAAGYFFDSNDVGNAYVRTP